MTEKQVIRHLANECKRLAKERKRLRSIVDEAASCINASAHGHTPNWRKLMRRIEAYEDAYSPAGDVE